jgi:hypothetical protein
MTKRPAATIQQLDGRGRFFVFERRVPVPETLHRQAVQFAILPLIQITTAHPSKCRRQNASSSKRVAAANLGMIVPPNTRT